MTKTPDRKAVHVYYSGLVHGVGFRFTAEREAAALGLKGWVKNLYDGRVEVAAEGGEEDLKKFMSRMQDIFKEYIRDVDAQWSESTGRFIGFDIRF